MKQQAKTTVSLLIGILMAVLVSFSLPLCAFAAQDDTQTAVSYIARTREFGTGVVTATEQPLTEPAKTFPGAPDSGRYAISSDQTVSDRVTVPAGSTVNLWLCDGATLSCSEGIGATSGANFTGNSIVMAVFEKHEHQYRCSSWDWAADNSSAAATFTCACGDVQTVDAEITTEEITPADCTNEQVVIYTAIATFGGDTYTDETGAVPVPGSARHVYGIRITPATCTHDGITTYKCVRCGNTYTENPVPAIGHRDDDHNGVCDNCGEPMPDSPDTPLQGDRCKWCGKTHRGFRQSIVGFWHTIFYFWAHLFGRR